MDAITRPVMRYHGGKWRLAPWLIAQFPPHRIYVEPFGGAASVLLRKPPLAAEVYNDLDGTVVNVFRVLRDPQKGLELQRRLSLTPYARAEFETTYQPAVDDIDLAHKTIMRSFMGHGSDSVTRSCRTGFLSRITDTRALPSQSWGTFADVVPLFVERLRGVVIEERPALEVIARFDTAKTLFYVDPPYVHSSRSTLASRGSGTHGYAHELNDAEHLELLARLCAVKGMVALSGYSSALYDDALAGWQRTERKVTADRALPRTEVLWLNPAAAAALQPAA